MVLASGTWRLANGKSSGCAQEEEGSIWSIWWPVSKILPLCRVAPPTVTAWCWLGHSLSSPLGRISLVRTNCCRALAIKQRGQPQPTYLWNGDTGVSARVTGRHLSYQRGCFHAWSCLWSASVFLSLLSWEVPVILFFVSLAGCLTLFSCHVTWSVCYGKFSKVSDYISILLWHK